MLVSAKYNPMSDTLNKPSWEECLQTHRKYAYWTANKLYPQRDPAHRTEAQQAALIGLYEAYQRWDPSISKLTTYSYWYIRKAVTQQVSEYMQDYAHDDVSTYADELPAEDSYEQTKALMLDLLRNPVLRPLQADVLRLRYIDDLTLSEAAVRLAVTSQRVSQLEHSALAKLRGLAKK